jgi:hypothetical protein
LDHFVTMPRTRNSKRLEHGLEREVPKIWASLFPWPQGPLTL